MLDLKGDLNDQQYEAVCHVDGPLLVIAGAGSGKTRVITYRVANLVENHGVRPWRILAVTFTNKAAAEMRERVGRLLGAQGIDCWVSTFHATCAKLLRIHGEQAGIDPRFTIYDDSDQKAMVARCLKELGAEDKAFPPRLIQHEINRAKQELIGPADYPATDYFRRRVQEIYALYEQRMRGASALDFGDLLLSMVVGMGRSEALFAAVSGRFDYILVDEFQDTNRVQLELVRLLARPHGNICVVGDDDQSIYSWRGANIANILEFERHFPGARVVTLERNYRSTANILGAAHGVVSRLPGRRPKKLWTTAGGGEKIGLIEAADERDEARLVARAVGELKGDGYRLEEQAVLYRINAQSRVFEELFRNAGIPYRVVGGMRFYERAEIKDLLAYLRLVQNPGDLAAFLRVINEPPRGIGKKTVEKLAAIAASAGIPAYEAIPVSREAVGASAFARLVGFRDLVERWRADLAIGPAQLTGRILEETGYLEGLEAENTAEADARIENLRELVGAMEQFEEEAETGSVSAFLELTTLQTDIDAVDFEGDQVTLMTVHAAKGLEFDVVHVTGLEERLFPYKPGGDPLFDVSEEEIDEERRLCYVAMTRARKRLFCTYARARRIFGQMRIEPPSRFVRDMPANLLVDLTPARPAVTALGRPRAPASRKPSAAAGTWVDRSYDQTAEAAAIYPGQKAAHAIFGVGKVVAVRPGAVPKVVVAFPGYGQKTIVADHLDFD